MKQKFELHTLGASTILISRIARGCWISGVVRYELSGATLNGLGVTSRTVRICFVTVLNSHATVVARIGVDEGSYSTPVLRPLDLFGHLL